jgi:hypothetical protein
MLGLLAVGAHDAHAEPILASLTPDRRAAVDDRGLSLAPSRFGSERDRC